MSQLKKIKEPIKRRREIVNLYDEHFKSFEELILPYEDPDVNSNFHLYVLQIKENPKFDCYDLFTYLQIKNYRPKLHYIPVLYCLIIETDLDTNDVIFLKLKNFTVVQLVFLYTRH